MISNKNLTEKFNCPVCNFSSSLLDVVDFNKSCEEARGKFLPLSGKPIYYHMCDSCNFTFSKEMHEWTEQDFLKHVYNDEYIDVDPDYLKIRPEGNANLLQQIFPNPRDIIHLDYGGGNGILSNELKNKAWNSFTYDPFPSTNINLSDLGKFNLITAFEVFEHVPDINSLIGNLSRLMMNECIVIFSTLLSDDQLMRNSRINWWYASPRNGHISLFSRKSLDIIAKNNGWNFGSFNQGMHLFYTTPPSWANHIFK